MHILYKLCNNWPKLRNGRNEDMTHFFNSRQNHRKKLSNHYFYLINKGRTTSFDMVRPMWLALLSDFRAFDWIKEYKYPTVMLDQMKGLLAKYENV